MLISYKHITDKVFVIIKNIGFPTSVNLSNGVLKIRASKVSTKGLCYKLNHEKIF